MATATATTTTTIHHGLLSYSKHLRLLHNLCRYRTIHTTPTTSATTIPPLNFTDPHPPATTIPPPSTDDTATGSTTDGLLDLHDVKRLFSSVSNVKLVKTSVALQMAAMDPVVDVGMWLMNSRLIQTGLMKGVIKRTVYDHFVAGTDTVEAGRTVVKLWENGLRGMLDYGLEHAVDNPSCDRSANEFIATIESTKSLPPSSVSFVVVKITAICPIALLKRVSDLLRWEYKNASFQLPWKLNTLPIFADSSPFYHTLSRPDPLTLAEESDLQLAHQRLMRICEKCIDANVSLVIDAEDTSIQPGIDYFTYSAAIMYNKGEKPVVTGTMQAYLKDARDRLIRAKRAADKMGLPMGFKLVRGAYMSSERHLASSLGVESPIHDSIQQTHACYNECASFMLDEVANSSGTLVLATHNIESGELAAKKARELGIERETGKLQFAQLYGMADALTFGLRNAGFNVSKYLPFGPVDQIMPYLLRRAEENKGLLSSSTLDRLLIREELKRRIKASVMKGL